MIMKPEFSLVSGPNAFPLVLLTGVKTCKQGSWTQCKREAFFKFNTSFLGGINNHKYQNKIKTCATINNI